MTNPLFPTNQSDNSYLMPDKQKSAIAPVSAAGENNPAADLIREKLRRLYDSEPDAKQELVESQVAGKAPSKHQEFMRGLSESGHSLAEIQTAWHAYYVSLPDAEKHQVWQEFYANASQSPYQQLATKQAAATQPAEPAQPASPVVASTYEEPTPVPSRTDKRTVADIKQQLLNRISAGGKLDKKHHLQSLAFGVATGLAVMVIFLFSFFNEVVLAPFIQPSRTASSVPVIVDPASVAISGGPKIIIPKINVEIPVDYTQATTDDKAIEAALDNGIVHYPTTVKPGEKGNGAYFGHSSNNIFNPGKYKFAFVLLNQLVEGDTFYLTRDGKVYIYKVFSKTIVKPTEVGVLNAIPGHTATATLITCDPPGTSINRLVVVGDQISPAPDGNTDATTPTVTTAAAPASNLPGNGPTLLSRLWNSVF